MKDFYFFDRCNLGVKNGLESLFFIVANLYIDYKGLSLGITTILLVIAIILEKQKDLWNKLIIPFKKHFKTRTISLLVYMLIFMIFKIVKEMLGTRVVTTEGKITYSIDHEKLILKKIIRYINTAFDIINRIIIYIILCGIIFSFGCFCTKALKKKNSFYS